MLRFSSELASAARFRARAMPQRLGSVAVMAAVLHLAFGWELIWLWVLAYGLVSFLESAIGRIYADRVESGSEASGGLYVACIALVSLTYGSLSAPLTLLEHGRDGEVYAFILLAGGLINLLVVSRGSWAAFLATAVPYGGYLLAGPILAHAAGVDDASWVGVFGATILVAHCLIAWRRQRDSLQAEARARAEAELRLRQAEAATAAKSAFVAMVSHELRTPLSGILAAGSRLDADHIRERRQAAEVVIDSGRFMQTLLDDLLDLAKLEAGRMTTEAVEFDLGHMIWSVERHWIAAARAAGKPLQLTSAVGLPTHVLGDPTRIRQILNNLLSNALKFTGPEGVSWSVDACTGPDCATLGGTALTVRVSDTGPGMSPEQLSRLFTAYEQTSESVARTHGGTGLGLAVSRELARLMGGELSVESAPGRGSVFTLHLPLQAVEAVRPQPATAEPERRAPTAARVLVVDDHPLNRRTLALLLEPAGLEVTAVESAAEALERLAAERFDAVLSDLHMPEMDGLALARTLRALAGPNGRVPVIAVTGADSEAERAACAAAGMTGYVAKPIEAAALYAALEAALAEGGEASALAGPRAA